MVGVRIDFVAAVFVNVEAMAASPASETWQSSTGKFSLQVFKGEASRCHRSISLTLAET
jgi:hypothetical protein